MREIKFKGIDDANDEWIYGSLVKVDEDYYILEDGEIKAHSYNKVDENSVGQYTGLKDKYNTEIYEGDILELTYFDDSKNVMYVSYSDSAKFVLIEQVKNISVNMEFFDKENMEVIGNIYEDKELLRKE